jgi:hypothetical protein
MKNKKQVKNPKNVPTADFYSSKKKASSQLEAPKRDLTGFFHDSNSISPSGNTKITLEDEIEMVDRTEEKILTEGMGSVINPGDDIDQSLRYLRELDKSFYTGRFIKVFLIHISIFMVFGQMTGLLLMFPFGYKW